MIQSIYSIENTKRRYLHSFMFSALLYSLLFLMLFTLLSQKEEEFSPKTEEINKIAINVMNFQVPKKQIVEPVTTPTPPKQTTPPPPKKKIVKQKVAEPIQKPIQKKIEKKETLKEVQKPLAKELEKPLVKKEVSKELLEAQRLAQEKKELLAQQQRQLAQKKREAKQNLFIQQLREQIDKNKSYPMTARRRGIEGYVEMRFVLHANGTVDNISFIDGRTIFQNSAHQAIAKSFPVNVEKELFSFPKEFKIKLLYTLI